MTTLCVISNGLVGQTEAPTKVDLDVNTSRNATNSIPLKIDDPSGL